MKSSKASSVKDEDIMGKLNGKVEEVLSRVAWESTDTAL